MSADAPAGQSALITSPPLPEFQRSLYPLHVDTNMESGPKWHGGPTADQPSGGARPPAEPEVPFESTRRRQNCIIGALQLPNDLVGDCEPACH